MYVRLKVFLNNVVPKICLHICMHIAPALFDSSTACINPSRYIPLLLIFDSECVHIIAA